MTILLAAPPTAAMAWASLVSIAMAALVAASLAHAVLTAAPADRLREARLTAFKVTRTVALAILAATQATEAVLRWNQQGQQWHADLSCLEPWAALLAWVSGLVRASCDGCGHGAAARRGRRRAAASHSATAIESKWRAVLWS